MMEKLLERERVKLKNKNKKKDDGDDGSIKKRPSLNNDFLKNKSELKEKYDIEYPELNEITKQFLVEDYGLDNDVKTFEGFNKIINDFKNGEISIMDINQENNMLMEKKTVLF